MGWKRNQIRATKPGCDTARRKRLTLKSVIKTSPYIKTSQGEFGANLLPVSVFLPCESYHLAAYHVNRKTIPLLQLRRPPCESQDFSTIGAALASPISRTTVLQERLAALGELPFSKMGARLGAEAEGLEDGWGNGFFVTSVSRSVRMCGRTHETIWLRLARQFPLRFATRIHHGVMALQP